jgi:CheY-like chemotaxis protein
MPVPASRPRSRVAERSALRHDLLNPLNVLAGAASGLLDSDLTDTQRAWVQMIQSATARLQDIAEHLERYEETPLAEGRARFADLLSIAAARVAKPFDRSRLVNAIESVAGTRRLRVLLVDDSPDLARLVETYLNRTGWTLDVVDTGERAVAQAMTEPYDVVLMDIDLPGVDGATAAHAIRAADLARGVPPTPIIAMTAFDPGPGDEPGASPNATGAVRAQAAGPDAAPVVTIDDPEVAPLVPAFLELRRADVRAFRDALRTGAYPAIQFTAHKMKGTGRGYGFTTISRLGGDLELAAHEQDVARMTELIDELDDYLARVQVVTPQ